MLPFRVGLDNRAWSHAQTAANAHVAKLARSFRQRLVERIGLSEHRAVVEPVTRAHECGRLTSRKVLRPLASLQGT